MKIAIDALCAENRSGTGRYASELLKAFRQSPADTLFAVRLYDDSPLVPVLNHDRRFEITTVPRRGTFHRVLFQNREIRRWIKNSRADLFHGPAFYIPPECPTPAIVTIHDIVFHLFPQTTPLSRRWYYRRAFRRSMREADMVLCDSENTRWDVIEHFSVSGLRARAIHLGVEERFFQPIAPESLETVRKRYSLPPRFILSLGTLEPRKNLERLIEAYRSAKNKSENLQPLVLAGRSGWGPGDLDRLIVTAGLQEQVLRPGFIDDNDLPALYRMADFFVHVSLYEGFGLPLLEAMASGTAVIAGDNSSQMEIIDDPEALVDASSVGAIAQSIRRLAENENLRQSMGASNRERARSFSWTKCAEQTLEAYRECSSQTSLVPVKL